MATLHEVKCVWGGKKRVGFPAQMMMMRLIQVVCVWGVGGTHTDPSSAVRTGSQGSLDAVGAHTHRR